MERGLQVLGRAQLYASTFWGIRRPQIPLTSGHFVIRLTDPSLAFSPDSASDLLHCYSHLRQALTDISGATAAQLYISRNWSPVGDAIGEPLSETSTPTLHVFVSWPGSSAASAALRLPAHLRQAVTNCAAIDESLRLWSSALVNVQTPDSVKARITVAGSPPLQPVNLWQSQAFLIDAAPSETAEPSLARHWTAVPRAGVESLDHMGTQALLELAAGVEHLAWNAGPRHAGMTVWATDIWGGPTSLDIFARQHGQGTGQVATFVAAGGLDLY